MKKFKVTVKINELNPLNNKYEFMWEGDMARSDVEVLDILVDAEEEIDAYSVIAETSNKTVTVLNVILSTEEDIYRADGAEDAMNSYIELCVPVDNKLLLQNIPISVGNN